MSSTNNMKKKIITFSNDLEVKNKYITKIESEEYTFQNIEDFENLKQRLEEEHNDNLLIWQIDTLSKDSDIKNKIEKVNAKYDIPIVIFISSLDSSDLIKHLQEIAIGIFLYPFENKYDLVFFLNNYFGINKSDNEKLIDRWFNRIAKVDPELKSLLKENINSLSTEVEQLERLVLLKNIDEIESVSHKIKGICYNYKMNELGEYTDKICELSRTENVESKMTKIASLFLGFKGLYLGISQIYNSKQTIDIEDEKNSKILIADDVEMNRVLMKKYIEKLGFKSDFAEDGLEVISKLNLKNYKVLFLDMKMPNMDGFDVLDQIDKNESFGDLNIVAISGDDRKENIKKCQKAGCDEYISKSPDLEELKRILKKFDLIE